MPKLLFLAIAIAGIALVLFNKYKVERTKKASAFPKL